MKTPRVGTGRADREGVVALAALPAVVDTPQFAQTQPGLSGARRRCPFGTAVCSTRRVGGRSVLVLELESLRSRRSRAEPECVGHQRGESTLSFQRRGSPRRILVSCFRRCARRSRAPSSRAFDRVALVGLNCAYARAEREFDDWSIKGRGLVRPLALDHSRRRTPSPAESTSRRSPPPRPT